MLQVARLAPRQLGEAAERVHDFLREHLNDDGGGRDRAGASDLYYTVFVLEGLLALQAGIPTAPVASYLESFGDGEGLDIVHLCCLARCWACLPGAAPAPVTVDGMTRRIEEYRNADGGFSVERGGERGTVYHTFMTLGAYQDLERECQDLDRMIAVVEGLRADDGAYANSADFAVGGTPVTAAAATFLRYVGRPVSDDVAPWLLARVAAEGGFLAIPDAPLPDLLSTATALHALSGLKVDLEPVREACLDFIDTLWTGRAFCGHWADDAQDAEYTYYALLALGHLSL